MLTVTEQGAKTVAELLDLLDAPLQNLLDALISARRAKLIERIDKSALVRATAPGCRVADVIRRKVREQGRASSEQSAAKGEGG